MNRFLIERQKCTRLKKSLQWKHRRSTVSQNQIHKILMRKIILFFFFLVFRKTNLSVLLFLIRQSNPFLQKYRHVRTYMWACTTVCSVVGTFCTIILMFKQTLPCHSTFCPYSSAASFLLYCFLHLILMQLHSWHWWESTSPARCPLFLLSISSSSFTFLLTFTASLFAAPSSPFSKGTSSYDLLRMLIFELLKTSTVLVFLRYFEITLPPP